MKIISVYDIEAEAIEKISEDNDLEWKCRCRNGKCNYKKA